MMRRLPLLLLLPALLLVGCKRNESQGELVFDSHGRPVPRVSLDAGTTKADAAARTAVKVKGQAGPKLPVSRSAQPEEPSARVSAESPPPPAANGPETPRMGPTSGVQPNTQNVDGWSDRYSGSSSGYSSGYSSGF